ncbi:MAG TPA: BON domain-containing protein [Geomonas sp.]|nr:BON domain-containing protein [Geomonas sp.]
MIRAEEVIGTIQAAFEREPRVGVHNHQINIEFADGTVTLSGEVDGIAAKKLALELAAAPSPVSGIVDRLRVQPSERMEDGAIRDHVCDALLGEPAFDSYSIRALVKQEMEAVRMLDDSKRILEVEVADGVVTLNGTAESLSHKRLAGVLAWWVPGSRDVVNGIELSPPMEDNDDETRDLLRLVLEKDPMVNASQIRISCRKRVITLDGVVASRNSSEAAESDAWFVFGVDRVINNLEVLA